MGERAVFVNKICQTQMNKIKDMASEYKQYSRSKYCRWYISSEVCSFRTDLVSQIFEIKAISLYT